MAFNWFKKKHKKDEETDQADGKPTATINDGDLQETDEIDTQENDFDVVAENESESSQLESAQTPPQIIETHPQETALQPNSKNGLFARLKRGLTKTRQILTTDIEDLFSGKTRLDDDMLEEIEELLITSDIGVQTTMRLIEALSKKASKIDSSQKLKEVLKQEILDLVTTESATEPQASQMEKPHVIMVIGVNGVGKTTTIGKLAAKKVQEGQKVMIAAADTFRAAAIDQLAVWAERAGANIIKHKENADPAAVVFDGMQAAKARGVDTLFVDTAGRLHTKVNLMEELKKIHRTISKLTPTAPHEILLVLDATTGQNAISQAKLFHESIGITGLVLTKLDGTAKGGIVVSICRELQLPLHYIGVGEAMEDLQPFDAKQFVDALF